ncbi:hypothetical protein BN134_1735 [Cronobacter dublinensis 1210]|uniref:Cation transporter n=1 Tax=Cronobacter dublinensis 1210 TaxID=1208656 RepID=A0ABM9Q6C9_9ENTR|nr:hypothetical protein BN134_1735 [Cronobacter dublinensis 1210]
MRISSTVNPSLRRARLSSGALIALVAFTAYIEGALIALSAMHHHNID